MKTWSSLIGCFPSNVEYKSSITQKTWKIHGRFKFIDLLISCYGKWKEENPFYINFGFNIVSMIEHKDWEEDPSHWAQILPKCRPSQPSLGIVIKRREWNWKIYQETHIKDIQTLKSPKWGLIVLRASNNGC